MSFSYILTTDIGKVRLLINDTVALTAHFTDEEIQVFLDLAGSVYGAAAMACQSWAASLAAEKDSERIGDYAYTQELMKNKLALAEQFKKLENQTPAFEWAEMNFTDIEETE